MDSLKALFTYAQESDSRELRAYSMMLLSAGITPEAVTTYKKEIIELIKQSLDTLPRLFVSC